MSTKPPPRISVMMHAWNGSIWDLLHGPVRTSVGALRGLGMPDLEWQEEENALLDGVVSQSFRVHPRQVFLPLRFADVAAGDIVGVQRDFWRAAAMPGKFNEIQVTDGFGGVRTLSVKFMDDGAVAYKIDPYLFHNPFGLTYQADNPYWLGKTELVEFDPIPGPRDFLGDTTGDAVLYISSTYNSVGMRSITNPGDADAWPVWRIRGGDLGGVESFELYVGDGNLISGPIAVPFDHVLTIDTNPLRQSAILAGPSVTGSGNVTRELVDVEFYPIEPGASARAAAVLSGNGTAELELTPNYYRAF